MLYSYLSFFMAYLSHCKAKGFDQESMQINSKNHCDVNFLSYLLRVQVSFEWWSHNLIDDNKFKNMLNFKLKILQKNLDSFDGTVSKAKKGSLNRFWFPVTLLWFLPDRAF